MKRQMRMTAAVAMIVLATACIHKTGGTVTPMEKVTTDNAVFAQVNNTIEQGCEALVNAGVWQPNQAAPVIAWTAKVAMIHQQITALIGTGSTVSASSLQTIQTLLDQIQQSANTLISSGAVNIKNPKSQQTVSADITSVITLGKTILAELQAYQNGSVQPATGGAM